jgi:hypothetical protein
MRRFLFSFVAALAICSIAMASVNLAQRRGPYRGGGYTREDVNSLIRRVEERSDAFVKIFDDALDKSAMDGSRKEDRLNDKAKELEKQLDHVREEFDRRENYRDVRENVAKAISASEAINKVIRNRRLNYEVQRQWGMLRSELNRLARVYDLRLLR